MKKFMGIILCLILALSLAACNTQPRMGSGNLVIATSGDYQLLLRDYLYFLGFLRGQTEDMLGQFMSEDEFIDYWYESFEDDGRTVFDDLKDSALEQVKASFSLYKLARSRGYVYDPDMIAMLREHVQETVVLLNSPERTGERAFYEMYYVTPQEIIETFRMLSTTDVFQQSLHDNIVVSAQDIRDFYDNPDNHDTVESLRAMTVAHILITFDAIEDDDEDDDDEEREAEREAEIEANRAETFERAESILARLQAGESFAELVVLYSEDPGSVDAEGQYYITRNAPFVPEFMEWSLEAEIGDLGIVETTHGLHIMNLVSRDTFEDMLEERELMVEGTTLPGLEAVVRHQLFIAEMDSILIDIQREWIVNTDLFDRIGFDVYARQR